MACSTRSTCGCARPAVPGRSRPRSTASRATRRTRPGPGSTWRLRARASSPLRRLCGARRRGHPRRARAGRATRESVAGDVVEMRGAIAQEKGDGERWDLKYAAGGLIDSSSSRSICSSFTPPAMPEILDTSTARVLDKALAARPAGDRGCRGAASGGAALSRPDADPAAVPATGRSIPRPPTPGLTTCWRAPPTCRISPRSRHRRGNAGQGAQELRADPGQGVLAPSGPSLRCALAPIAARQSGVAWLRFLANAAAWSSDGHPSTGSRSRTMRSAAERRADAHRAAVQLGQRLGDREAETGALMALGELALDLLERTSELRQRILRDADAGVDDGDARPSAPRRARGR